MAKKIIILDRGIPWAGQTSITYALWADVPVNLKIKYTKDSFWVSAYSGALSSELDSLRAGDITEITGSINIPNGTSVSTIKTILESEFNRFQNKVTNDSTYQFYGTFFDGTTWTTGGL